MTGLGSIWANVSGASRRRPRALWWLLAVERVLQVFDQDLGVPEACDDVSRQGLVREATIEALTGSIVPGTIGVDAVVAPTPLIRGWTA